MSYTQRGNLSRFVPSNRGLKGCTMDNGLCRVESKKTASSSGPSRAMSASGTYSSAENMCELQASERHTERHRHFRSHSDINREVPLSFVQTSPPMLGLTAAAKPVTSSVKLNISANARQYRMSGTSCPVVDNPAFGSLRHKQDRISHTSPYLVNRTRSTRLWSTATG